MVQRIEAVLVSQRFWIVAVAILIASPLLMTLIRWLEAQSDLLALCRGILLGGR